MNTLYKIFIVAVLFCLGSNLQAQQSLYNHYSQNSFLYNPAAAGENDFLSGYINFRDQWSGLKDAPEHFSLGVHGGISENAGVGFKINRQTAGIFMRTDLELSFAYNIKIDDTQNLRLGLNSGFENKTIDYLSIDDVGQADLSLFSNNVEESLFHAGFGASYNVTGFNFQLILPRLYSPETKTPFDEIYGSFAYDYVPENNTKWLIRPSVLGLSSRFAVQQFYLSFLVQYDHFWVQASFRNNNDAAYSIGVDLNGVKLAYAYEIGRSPFSRATNGTHELMVAYQSPFKLYKNAKQKLVTL